MGVRTTSAVLSAFALVVGCADAGNSGDASSSGASAGSSTGPGPASTTAGVGSSGSSGAADGSTSGVDDTSTSSSTGEAETDTEGDACSLTLTGHEERWFATPEVTWDPVDGARGYLVEIAETEDALDAAPIVDEDVEDSWSGELEPGEYVVRVTAQPGGETCTGPLAVRTIDAMPSVTSPQQLCGDAKGVGTRTSYGVAAVGGHVYSSINIDGAGLCRYDAETLAFEVQHPGHGGNFRTFGVASDPTSGAVMVTTFPFLGTCGDTLERLLVYADPANSGSFEAYDSGIESPTSVAVDAEGVAHLSGLWGGSCWQEDTFCLDLGDPCTNGFGFWAVHDLEAGSLNHGGSPTVGVGVATDATHTYRAGLNETLEVFEAAGAHVTSLPIPAPPRGVIRVDVGGDRLLIATLMDATLRAYRLPEEGAPDTEDALVEVHQVQLDDNYWQGAYDPEEGALFFPAQNTLTIRRHDL